MNYLIFAISVSVYVLYASADTVLTNPISGASYNCSGQIDSTYSCSKAFDNNVNSAWVQSINTSSPQYAVIALLSPMTVASYQVYMIHDGYYIDGYDYSWQLSSWTFEGSNDGSNYTILSTVDSYFPSKSVSNPKFYFFNCSSPGSYKYYRFCVKRNWFIDNRYSEVDTFILVELQLILKSASPTTIPTAMPSVFVRHHFEPPTSMPSTFLQSSIPISMGVIITIAVVLIIIIPLAAIFFSYVWSGYKLSNHTKSNPDDNFSEGSPEERTELLS